MVLLLPRIADVDHDESTRFISLYRLIIRRRYHTHIYNIAFSNTESRQAPSGLKNDVAGRVGNTTAS